MEEGKILEEEEGKGRSSKSPILFILAHYCTPKMRESFQRK